MAILNPLKKLKSKWGVILLTLCLFPLFQNCDIQKLNGTQEMALPNDIKVVSPKLASFNERTGVFQNYNVEVNLENGRLIASFMNDASSATAPIIANSCQFSVNLTPEQTKELKSIVGRVLICKGVGDGDGKVCAGSCPNRKVSFASNSYSFHVNFSNLGEGSLYFCGGEDKLKAYLLDLIKSNLQINCPSDFDQILL